MSFGIKNYGTYVTHEIDRIRSYVNLSRENANLNLSIDLYSSNLTIPINLTLTYSFKDRINISEFGRGMRLNFFKKVNVYSDKIRVDNNDFSSDVYLPIQGENNKFRSYETKTTIDCSSNNEILIVDDQGNKLIYNGTNYKYPISIFEKNMNDVTKTITLENSKITKIESIDLETAEFEYDGGYVKTINVYRTDQESSKKVWKINFIYDDNYRLVNIEFVSQVNTEKSYSLVFTYEEELLTKIHNSLTNEEIRYSYLPLLGNYYVNTIQLGHSTYTDTSSLTIDYYTEYTEVTYHNGRKIKHFFDNNNLLSYKINDYGKTSYFEYENNELKYQNNNIINNKDYQEHNMIEYGFNLVPSYFSCIDIDACSYFPTGVEINPCNNLLGEEVLKLIKNTSDDIRSYMYKALPKNGNERDAYVFNIWYRQGSIINQVENILTVNISFYYRNNEMGKYTIQFPYTNNPKWMLKNISLYPYSSYDTIYLELQINGNGNSCYIDGLSLVENSSGRRIEYNSDGYPTSLNNEQYEFDDKGLLAKETRTDGRVINYSYDEKNNLISKEIVDTCLYEYQYDGKNNCIYEKITDLNTNKYMEISNEYNNESTVPSLQYQYLTKSIDERGRITNYNWDSLYKLLTKVVNAEGVIERKEYNNEWKNLTRLIVQKNSNSLEEDIKIVYNSDQSINRIYLDDVSYYKDYYEFIYNDKKRLTTVKKCNSRNLNYGYETRDMVIENPLSKQYGYGDIYYFEYDQYGRLIKVTFKEDESLTYSEIIAEYTYDIFSKLLTVRYYDFQYVTLTYTYDEQERIKTINDSRGEVIEYSYDEEGNVTSFKTDKHYQTYSSEIISVQKTAYEQVKNIKHISLNDTVLDSEKIYSGLLKEDEPTKLDYEYGSLLEPKVSESYYEPIYQNITIIKENNMICVDNEASENILTYRLGSSSRKGSISFWFKPNSNILSSNRYLLHVGKYNENCFRFRLISGKIALDVYDNNQNMYTIFTTENTVYPNEWNYTAFSFEKIDNTNGISELKVLFKLNEKTKEEVLNGNLFTFPLNTDYNICGIRNNDGSLVNDSKMNAKITCLKLTNTVALNIYEVMKNFYLEREYVLGKVRHENMFYENECLNDLDIYYDNNNFDSIPLNHSFTSYKGVKPKNIGRVNLVYLNEIGRTCYYACGEELVYDYELGLNGQITMNCYFLATNEKSYLFECKDLNGCTLGLFRNATKKLIIECNGGQYDTGQIVENNVWAKIGMLWTEENNFLNVKVLYNGTSSNKFALRSFNNQMDLSIGVAHYSIINPYKLQETALFGYIDNVTVYTGYTNQTVLYNICNLGKATLTKKFNNFHLPIKKTIRNINNTILENEYTYETIEGNKVSSRIVNEKIGNSNYQYTYYENGNLKEIKLNGTIKNYYEYDHKGQLTKEISYEGNFTNTYTYDKKGNITYKINELNLGYNSSTYTYDYTYSGFDSYVLTNVNDVEITYDTAKRNPEMIGDVELVWKGIRLKELKTPDNEYVYRYNHQGLRVCKVLSNNKHIDYFYENNKLVKEEVVEEGVETNKRYFYYDKNNQLYAIRYNDEMYYYIRNIFGNILGLIDKNGNQVVSYEYDAWGKMIYIDGSMASTLGNDNPFRYKGYYYDDETQLYYLNSRYYSPELCRFISSDDIEYLDPESINGLNLYAYCGNNPVNNIDPSGHFVISTLALIIMGAAVLTTAGAITYGAIKEETIVLDLSCSIPNTLKVGGSLVLDFKGKNIEFYPHIGQAYGISSGFSYSVGKVWNYTKPGSYGGFFAFGGGGYLIGVDACLNPFNPSGASATSITFSSSASLYGGWDWYFDPISFNYEKWKFNKIKEEN